MTDDKQIEAAFEPYEAMLIEKGVTHPIERAAYQALFIAGYKAAIEASHAKYVPELVEALKCISKPTDETCGKSAIIARQALAKLPEELRG